jgi:quercetin dioxygenase-like cupin family protein
MTNQKSGNKNSEVSTVHQIANLISYQPQSVVSRIIMKNKSGSVTLFAFDQSESLSEHTAPFDALVMVLDGKAEIVISGKHQTLGTGDIIIMPANEPHSVRARQKLKMLLTMLKN